MKTATDAAGESAFGYDEGRAFTRLDRASCLVHGGEVTAGLAYAQRAAYALALPKTLPCPLTCDDGTLVKVAEIPAGP